VWSPDRSGIPGLMRIPEVLRPPEDPRNGPVTLRRELLATGLDDRAIRRLQRAGDLVRIRHGAYVDSSTWDQLDESGRFGLRGRAVLRQARTSVVLSHTSSLPEYGAPTWGFDLSTVQITRTDGLAGRHEAGVQQHCGRLRPGDFIVVNGVPVTNPARAVLETVSMKNTEAALCVANFMLHAGYTTEHELAMQYVGMESWPDTLAAEIVLRLADGRIESVGESRTYWCCYRHSLPMPVPQFEVSDDQGLVVARVDFAWPEYGVFLEFDGRIKYEKLLRPGERASDVVIREKEREALVCRLTGWRCIRVTWAELQNPARLAARIRDALFCR
jgi:hypothetical protein